VPQKKVTLFIFVISLSNFIRFCKFLAETCPRKFETNTCTCSIHISFYMFVLYLVNTATHQNAHSNVGHFPFVFSLNRNVVTCFKAYLNFWHSNLYQKIHELTYYPQKREICINFLSKCKLQRRLIATWSVLVCISVSSTRQSTTWRGRLRACVRTDGWDFKHLLG